MINKKIFKYTKNKRSAGEGIHPLKDGNGNLLSKEVDIGLKKKSFASVLKKVIKDSCEKKT